MIFQVKKVSPHLPSSGISPHHAFAYRLPFYELRVVSCACFAQPTIKSKDMTDLLPSVVSLHPLRDQWPTDRPSEENARRTVVKKIEASFKKFGCVCVPVSDLDNQSQEVRATTWVLLIVTTPWAMGHGPFFPAWMAHR